MRRLVGVGLCCWLLLSTPDRGRADVLTQHNDNARTGVNAAETTLTTSNVKPDSFGKLWTLYADAQVVAQPLYVSQLAVDTSNNPNAPLVRGTFNAVIVATMHNTIYAYDADRENRLPDGRTKPLWATWLGLPRPGGKDIDMWSTNDPTWGILGTPVIDPQKTTLWAVAWHNDAGKLRYRLHSLNLRDGSARKPAVVIGGDAPNPQQPCSYPGGYNPCLQKQRTALLLDRGVIYAGFGGDGHRGNLFAFDAASLQSVAFWSTTPSGGDGGIWQSGQGPAADADGNVYLMTANGTFGVRDAKHNYGQSFVKLKLENGAIAVKDHFTPCNAEFMNGLDMDLGSAGPLLIPNTNLLVGGGKDGMLYLLSRADLGKFVTDGVGPNCKNPKAVQEFQATDLHVHGAGTMYGHIHGSPVFWRGPNAAQLYVWGENDRLKAYKFQQGRFAQLDHPQKSLFQPLEGMPGGMLSLSSKGNSPGTGILWAVVPLDGDANKSRGIQGIVLALHADDISRELWTSQLVAGRDRLGLFAKFTPPTVAGGKLFVATYGDKEAPHIYGGNQKPQVLPQKYHVAVYGLLPPGQKPKPIVNQAAGDVTVINATATTALSLDTRNCRSVGQGNADCTAALERTFGAPSLQTLIVPAGYDFAGCNLLRVEVASKHAALVSATGIGWYAADATAGSQSMTSGRFVAKGSLKQTGIGTLKNGSPADLHEFIGSVNCSVGMGSADKLFKPYMQFENAPDGKVYRNWDFAHNYRITRVITEFDRSAEILAR